MKFENVFKIKSRSSGVRFEGLTQKEVTFSKLKVYGRQRVKKAPGGVRTWVYSYVHGLEEHGDN